MSDELINPTNLSLALVKDVFESAYLEISDEKDGEFRVKGDPYGIWVRPNLDNKDRIRLYILFIFNENTTIKDRLDFVNKVNDDYIMVTSVVSDDVVVFKHDLMIDGGISKKNLVLTAKRLSRVVSVILEEENQGLIK